MQTKKTKSISRKNNNNQRQQQNILAMRLLTLRLPRRCLIFMQRFEVQARKLSLTLSSPKRSLWLCECSLWLCEVLSRRFTGMRRKGCAWQKQLMCTLPKAAATAPTTTTSTMSTTTLKGMLDVVTFHTDFTQSTSHSFSSIRIATQPPGKLPSSMTHFLKGCLLIQKCLLLFCCLALASQEKPAHV